ncbi:hypothetical protein [Hydromonas duriensis]|uniref:Histidine kinase/DNA gyrase B/HSP90-like ATPase n=1 Tax=Hydromonas duriensis TaxID=1527608 RepID=A0A4R6Y961_9BURK|nr:hypothetical protein [Hydromonas duriensis]TDR31968.1 hypothetical protein DFR44_10631 [Hydromonas duriensis]
MALCKMMTVPRSLSLQNAIDFCNTFWDISDEVDEIVFDFRFLEHIEPFGMAYVSSQISEVYKCQSKRGVRFKAQNYKEKSYLAHMGFFKAFGLDFGKSPGQAGGSSSYLPLTIINIEDIKKEAFEKGEAIGNLIEAKSSSLARMLIRADSGELFDTLTYSLREVMRNVVEHSNSSVLEFCAQFWPTKNKVEIVVLDLGVGIKNSLSNNPYLSMSCDRDALQLSLLPGVSGKMYKGVKKNHNDVWQNSGFGLYMTSRIARTGGEFFIASGKSGLLLKLGQKINFDLVGFSGTVLRMVINTSSLKDLKSQLKKFKNEGYCIASELKNWECIESSVASMMLSRDFLEIV